MELATLSIFKSFCFSSFFYKIDPQELLLLKQPLLISDTLQSLKHERPTSVIFLDGIRMPIKKGAKTAKSNKTAKSKEKYPMCQLRVLHC